MTGDIPTAFKKFDEIRRPRIERLYKLAMQSGDMTRETGPWMQWAKEWSTWLFLKVAPKAVG